MNNKMYNFNNNNKNLHRFKTTNKKSISGDQKVGENVKAFWATNLYSRDDQKKIEQAEAQTKVKLGESTSGLTLDQIAQGRGHLLSHTQKNDLYVKAFELYKSIEKNKKEMRNKNKGKEIQTKNWIECQELERIKLDLENGNLTDLPDDIAVDFDALSIPSLVEGDKDGAIDEKGKGYQTLNYAGLTPTAIAAIKELIAKVETLEAEVAALKSS